MKKILFMMGVAALALTSCSQEEVINANTGKKDNAITFRVRSSKQSRAAEFSTDNLKEFMVYGFKGWPEDNYEAGEDLLPYFENGEPVKFSESEGGLFTSAKPYYYPADGSWLYFAAYAPSTLTGISTSTYGGLKIDNFTVAEAIEEQIDLIFANGGSTLEPDDLDQELTFTHALTKVFVSTAMNSDTRYKFEIAGVKFGNIHNSGDYEYRGEKALAEPEEDDINGQYREDGYIQDYDGNGHFWKPAGEQTGEMTCIFDTPVVLDNDNTSVSVMSGDDTAEAGKECFMLIPQQLSAKFLQEDGTLGGKFEDGMTYIALLVRITYLPSNEVIYPFSEGVEAITETVGGTEYAWAAFPVASLWVPGTFIDYAIDFSNGAGYVAPGADETYELKPILGREIKFLESVLDWNTGTNITVDQNNELGTDVGNFDDPFGE